MRRFFISSLLVMSLNACGPAQESKTSAPDPAPISATPMVDGAPAHTPDPEKTDCGTVSFDGYCGIAFGMSAREAESAFRGVPLVPQMMDENDPPETACYFLNEPSGAYLYGFMVENDSIQRVSISTEDIQTDAGARVGMTREALLELYPDARSEPNAYTDFDNLIVNGDAGHKIIFEFLSDDTAYIYRAGIEPGIDYIEGCL